MKGKNLLCNGAKLKISLAFVVSGEGSSGSKGLCHNLQKKLFFLSAASPVYFLFTLGSVF